jgi:hypothetical protein
MMWRRAIVPLPIVGAVLLFQSPVQGQAGEPQPAVSIERIRAALKQPPSPLRLASPSVETPTFRVEIREKSFVLHPLGDEPFDPTFGLPSVGELLMSGIERIRSAAVEYKRGRAERRARQEVDDALAAFCAAHECPP